jgi:hypothetical protein
VKHAHVIYTTLTQHGVCVAPAACCAAGALEAQVGSEEQLVQVMHTGLAARTVAGARLQEQQSQQHTETICPLAAVMPAA